MIERVIHWSITNRFFVLLATFVIIGLGLFALRNTPVDALPDLSDVQVIIKTSYPGQSPQVVEDQVTYPLTTAMLSVPGAKTVRGFSFFGDSFVQNPRKSQKYGPYENCSHFWDFAFEKIRKNVQKCI